MNIHDALADYLPDGLIPASVMPSLFQGTTAQTWAALRHKGNGPAFVKVMRRVYYQRRDVEAWLNGNRFSRTDRPVSRSSALTPANGGGPDAA
jgi:hypothetical protein